MRRLLVIATLLLAPLAAGANMLHTPWVPAVEQDGQDVVLTVAIFAEASADELCGAASTPGIDDAYTLLRTYPYEGGPEAVVFADRVFDIDDAVGAAACHSCDWADPDQCYDEPDSCVDCDDDSVAECPGFCLPAYVFEVIDECVPPSTELVDPASVFYRIFESTMGELGMNGLNVIDTGDECLDGDADSDVDSDSDFDADTDGDDGCCGYDDGPMGCAVGGAGRGSDPSLLLVLLMLAVAGAALGRER